MLQTHKHTSLHSRIRVSCRVSTPHATTPQGISCGQSCPVNSAGTRHGAASFGQLCTSNVRAGEQPFGVPRDLSLPGEGSS
eukprot:scaffold34384_cov63-Phaeocystis_antarctica.AAC.4